MANPVRDGIRALGVLLSHSMCVHWYEDDAGNWVMHIEPKPRAVVHDPCPPPTLDERATRGLCETG
jgi:hypothetical protein